MRSRLKFALLALSTGVLALSTGTCLLRFLGDWAADQVWLGGIQ